VKVALPVVRGLHGISPPYSKSRSCQAFAERYDLACRGIPNRS